MAARGPSAHHGVGYVGMKLKCKGGAAVTKRLHWEGVALRQQVGTERQVEALTMPLIDLLRPGIAHHASDIRWPDRIVANLGVTVGMPVDAAAEMVGEHLRAETDAKERLVLLERHAQPIDFTTDEIGGVVRAHGAAEDDRSGVAGHRLHRFPMTSSHLVTVAAPRRSLSSLRAGHRTWQLCTRSHVAPGSRI